MSGRLAKARSSPLRRGCLRAARRSGSTGIGVSSRLMLSVSQSYFSRSLCLMRRILSWPCAHPEPLDGGNATSASPYAALRRPWAFSFSLRRRRRSSANRRRHQRAGSRRRPASTAASKRQLQARLADRIRLHLRCHRLPCQLREQRWRFPRARNVARPYATFVNRYPQNNCSPREVFLRPSNGNHCRQPRGVRACRSDCPDAGATRTATSWSVKRTVNPLPRPKNCTPSPA